MSKEEKEEKAITPTEAIIPIVVPPLSPEEVLAHFNKIQDLKRRLISPETDVVKIANRPYILKSGWRKLAFAFNLKDEIVREEKEERPDGEVIYRIWTKVTAPNGRYVMAVGCASSKERKFTHEAHDPYALAHTRSKNRAISDIIGLGEVSAEEMFGVEVEKTELQVQEQASKQTPTTTTEPTTTTTTTTTESPKTTVVGKVEEPPPGAKFLTSHGKPYGYFVKTEHGGELYFDKPLDLENPGIKQLVESFLYGRVLDGIKQSRGQDGLFFEYTPIEEGGKLAGISFACDPEALDDRTVREICSSAGWTAARAAEKA